MLKRAMLRVSLLALLLGAAPGWAQWTAAPPDANNSRPNAVPAGTTFVARLEDKLDTRKLERGKKFKMRLMADLVAPNGAVIPRGRKIRGHVSSVERGINGRMILSFDEIETRKGWVPLAATVIGVPGEHGVEPQTGAEGEISRRGVDKKRAITAAAIGAGAGAVTGAVAGGTKGAIIGAAVGAGVGTGAGILTDRDLRLNEGQQLELRLDRAVVIPE